MRIKLTENSICIKHPDSKFYQEPSGKKRWRCISCNRDKTNKSRRNRKLRCIDYLGGRCIKCGYSKCTAALECHHRNPEEKDFNMSMSCGYSDEDMYKELDKCDLLCANCHREVHSELLGN